MNGYYGPPVGVYNAYPRGSIGSFLSGAVHSITGAVSHLGIPGVSAAAGFVSGITGHSVPAAPPALMIPGGGAMVNAVQRAGLSVPTPFGFNVGLGTGAGSFGANPMNAGYSPLGVTQYGGDVALATLHKYHGYHLNKSTYVRRRGGNLQLVTKGTVPVKNRSMNVGNGRAARRALSRLHGFARMARKIYTITHPKKGATHRFKRRK